MTVVAGLDEWLMLVHVLAAMAWFGAVLALSALSFVIVRSGDAESLARFVGGLRIVGPLVFAPAPLLLVGFGAWLVARDDSVDFGQTWVWLALVLFGIAFLFGAVFQSRAALRAERVAARSDTSEALRQLRRWAWGSQVILVLLVVATWDMVFKPGG